MRGSRRLSIILVVILLVACTVDESGQPTLPAPITLTPPAAITVQGTCDENSTLERWLQTTSLALSDFIVTMNSTAAQERAGMSDSIYRLAALRDAVIAAAAPDCGIGVQERMVDAMNTVVTTLQGYFNGDLPNLGSTIGDASALLDRVIAEQNELIVRLETQINQQNNNGQ
ncbi:MAG: hypothetical protein H6672_09480 [Anaerolineaceae bacterium]|nr:hypothetical protein [Anaerolineaceae bacterium]